MIDPADVRPMSPVEGDAKRMRCLIMGEPESPALPEAPTLNLSGFGSYHINSNCNHYSSSLPCYGVTVRPVGTPPQPFSLSPYTEYQQPSTSSSTSSNARKFQCAHAGLLRPYGGVRQFMRMQRGEIPWPTEEQQN